MGCNNNKIVKSCGYLWLKFRGGNFMLSKRVYIERIGEGSTIYCKSEIDDIVKIINDEYHANDVCIGELLSSLCIHGASIEDVAIIYAKLYDLIEDDRVFRITDDQAIDLARDFQ